MQLEQNLTQTADFRDVCNGVVSDMRQLPRGFARGAGWFSARTQVSDAASRGGDGCSSAGAIILQSVIAIRIGCAKAARHCRADAAERVRDGSRIRGGGEAPLLWLFTARQERKKQTVCNTGRESSYAPYFVDL